MVEYDTDLPEIKRTHANMWKALYFVQVSETVKANKGIQRFRRRLKALKSARQAEEEMNMPGEEEEPDESTAAVDCDCEDYARGITSINSNIDLATVHHGSGYTGKPFNFCPWCSKRLRGSEKEIVLL